MRSALVVFYDAPDGSEEHQNESIRQKIKDQFGPNAKIDTIGLTGMGTEVLADWIRRGCPAIPVMPTDARECGEPGLYETLDTVAYNVGAAIEVLIKRGTPGELVRNLHSAIWHLTRELNRTG